MPISPGRRTGRGSPVWSSLDSIKALFAVGLGGWLFLLAGGSLLKEIERVPVSSYFKKHEDRFQMSADEGRSVDRGIALHAGVSSSASDAIGLRRLGFLRLVERQRLLASKETPADGWLDPVRAPLVASLQKEPIDPLTWAYLADAESAFGGDKAKAFGYLNTSYLLAPVVPESALYRFRLAMRLRTYWKPDFEVVLRRDLASLFPASGWSPYRKAFVAAIKPYASVVETVGQLLRADKATYDRLQKAMKSSL